jgi:ABC-2 type transport system permease protein
MPRGAFGWPLFLISATLAVTVSFAVRYLISLTGFWLLDSDGVRSLVQIIGMFFSGMLLPITLFPGTLGAMAKVLPWSAMIQVPCDVFLEQGTGLAQAGALGFQALWAVLLLAAGRAVQGLATSKVVVQGG